MLSDAAHAIVTAMSSFGSQPHCPVGHVHVIKHHQNPLQGYLQMAVMPQKALQARVLYWMPWNAYCHPQLSCSPVADAQMSVSHLYAEIWEQPKRTELHLCWLQQLCSPVPMYACVQKLARHVLLSACQLKWMLSSASIKEEQVWRSVRLVVSSQLAQRFPRFVHEGHGLSQEGALFVVVPAAYGCMCCKSYDEDGRNLIVD